MMMGLPIAVVRIYEVLDLGEDGELWAIPAFVTQAEAAASLRCHLRQLGVDQDWGPFHDTDVEVKHDVGRFVAEETERHRWKKDPYGEPWTFVSLPGKV